ncbi:hypothetical protein AKH11_10840 [Vibrio parahaemolyticus]|nr:hypothetical protein AKH11_10840 [Vibrio parahaemolyticus]OCQ05459.1 hypothetical protein AKH09_14785 [Vibrio parahaemolyticus]ODW54539.1 hypothetical protein BBL86_05820 [Vibrio parahaemolyticus]
MVRHIIVLLTLITTSFASNSSQLTSEIFSEVLNTTAYELHDNLERLEKEDSLYPTIFQRYLTQEMLCLNGIKQVRH